MLVKYFLDIFFFEIKKSNTKKEAVRVIKVLAIRFISIFKELEDNAVTSYLTKIWCTKNK